MTAKQRGFALLITLTLLAFVVLLLVGLATYTRVETAIAGNMQRQAQARENALLALNVALEQLQKHAGPDTRVTATAENVAEVNRQKRYYTGVWNAVPPTAPEPVEGEPVPETPSAATPIAWLASGVETSTGVDITTAVPSARSVVLVGAKTDGAATDDATVAQLQDITAPGVPGATTSATPIGRYAWWIGDQGVKAPVAIGTTTNAVDYPPFVEQGAADLRTRIAQQIGLGAGAATGAGEPAFEVTDASNTSLVAGNKIQFANQFAFLRGPNDGAALGLAAVRQNFHAWSPNNFAVIADTRRGGLKQDLSLKPELLGASFAAWANYPAYMEPVRMVEVAPPAEGESPGGSTPTVSTAPVISPAYGTDPLRRRYVMTPHLMTGNTAGSHQVGPVLSSFFITFNVRTVDGSEGTRALEVRAGWMVSLWNPYSSALVPETLRLEIRGLPNQVVVRRADNESTVSGFSLRQLYAGDGNGLRVLLPWITQATNAVADDRQSWLPGRVHFWRSKGMDDSPVPAEGYEAEFYSKNFGDNGSNQGVKRTVPGGDTVDGSTSCLLEVSSNQDMEIRLFAVRSDGDVQIGRFFAPPFQRQFTTTARAISAGTYQFGYGFHLHETPTTWLTEAVDFRISRLPGTAYAFEQDDNPATYENQFTPETAKPGRLLDRASDSFSYNEDVPLFELPRAPVLSMGALQHFRITSARPFMIGNPWGSGRALNGYPLNSLFDRFYFSGLATGVTPSATNAENLNLPNPLLVALRKVDGGRVTADDMRATAVVSEPTPVEPTEPTPPTDGSDGEATEPTDGTPTTPSPGAGDARSSKYLLQAGAFNLNATSATAWAAVLRSVRHAGPEAFTYLNTSIETGTAADDAIASATASSEARFFRFSQSAQETYKAEPAQSAAGGETGITPPNTHLFRQGMRTLTAGQLAALAQKIADNVKAKLASTDAALGGPFRSVEEFLSPSSLYGLADAEGNVGRSRSVLEAAIEDSGVNAEIAEFSSQWLTQGDIMTALAPFLFPRSDTFLIRTHGQALNPATGAVEGKAWCEAVVQRVPEYMEPARDDATVLPADLQSELNKRYGRRFKIVSFRWLTLSDI